MNPSTDSREKLKIILLIDSADNKKITVGLKINSKKYLQAKKITSNEALRSKLRGIRAEFLRSQQPHFAKASLGVPLAPSSSEQALRFSAKGNKTQIVLLMIDKILKKHSLKAEDISAIQVNAGPGSFTGLRVGLTIANALSFALQIPINGKKVGEKITPLY